MARKKKESTDLLTDPAYLGLSDEESDPECGATPFDKAYSVLTCISGARLEMMTRTTPKLAQALGVGYNLMFNFKSAYIRGRLDTLMRIHVSMGGKGRAEMVQSLSAGSGVPGEYYDAQNPSMNSFVSLDGTPPGEE